MNREQINRLYAKAPVLLWPWIWVQLIVILARMEAAAMRGENATVLIGVSRWFTLHILFQSDNMSGYPAPEPEAAPRVTFASLCQAPIIVWDAFKTAPTSEHSAICAVTPHASSTNEYAEALRPVP